MMMLIHDGDAYDAYDAGDAYDPRIGGILKICLETGNEVQPSFFILRK